VATTRKGTSAEHAAIAELRAAARSGARTIRGRSEADYEDAEQEAVLAALERNAANPEAYAREVARNHALEKQTARDVLTSSGELPETSASAFASGSRVDRRPRARRQRSRLTVDERVRLAELVSAIVRYVANLLNSEGAFRADSVRDQTQARIGRRIGEAFPERQRSSGSGRPFRMSGRPSDADKQGSPGALRFAGAWRFVSNELRSWGFSSIELNALRKDAAARRAKWIGRWARKLEEVERGEGRAPQFRRRGEKHTARRPEAGR
jgi:hypothetical protein